MYGRGAFWLFSGDSSIRLANPWCYKPGQILPNDPAQARCPGNNFFYEILWDQGPASMAYFCRNISFLQNSQNCAGHLLWNSWGSMDRVTRIQAVKFSLKTVHWGKRYGRSTIGLVGGNSMKIEHFREIWTISRNIGNSLNNAC